MAGGRPKNIASPDELFTYWESFKQYQKSNPFKVKDWVGGMAKEVVREKERPLTLEGFQVWLRKQNVISWVDDYFKNKNKAYEEFSPICSLIRAEIRSDQIEGGMAGLYNPSITQRLNNLVEQQSNEVSVKSIVVRNGSRA